MEAHSQYSCTICGNLRTYGNGWPDDITVVVLIQCGHCKTNTPHKYVKIGDDRVLGGLPEMPNRF